MPEKTEKFIDDIACITAGKSEKSQVVRLKTPEEIIAAALVNENKEGEFDRLDGKAKFHYEIFTELLEDVSYRIKQLRSLFYSDFPWKAVERCEERLLTSLEALETGIDGYGRFIEARLLSENKDTVRVAVFVLASVRAKDSPSRYLDRVIKVMAGVEDDYIHCFADGLKLALNDQVGARLDLISEFVSPAVKSVCLEVIEYRRNFNIALLHWNDAGNAPVCILNRQSNDF